MRGMKRSGAPSLADLNAAPQVGHARRSSDPISRPRDESARFFAGARPVPCTSINRGRGFSNYGNQATPQSWKSPRSAYVPVLMGPRRLRFSRQHMRGTNRRDSTRFCVMGGERVLYQIRGVGRAGARSYACATHRRENVRGINRRDSKRFGIEFGARLPYRIRGVFRTIFRVPGVCSASPVNTKMSTFSHRGRGAKCQA